MNKIKKILNKATHWTLDHAISILVVIVVAWSCFLWIYYTKQVVLTQAQNLPQVIYTPNKKESKYYSELSGDPVESESLSKAPVTAVMIENSPSARPQSGLKNSDLVFEAIAEGGITRFLVLYQNSKPQLVGPVRSLRPYYVEWIKPFNASVAHVGGSKKALDEVRNGNYRDIDQFFNAKTYWRASDRYAPHNVYTSFEKIDALNKEKGYNESNFTGFKRIEEANKTKSAEEKTQVSNVTINISSKLYNTSYSYDKESNTYMRNLGGKPHLDREDGQISPRVVIAIFVTENTVMEDGARENIVTVGEGRAVIFQKGSVIEGKWSKGNNEEQLKFIDSKGKVIPLERGQTWISAVPNGKGNVSWQ